jgi:homoserine O-acetyltransferase
MTSDHCELFDLGDFGLQSGETLLRGKLAYKTCGQLNASRDNVVLLPTFYTGTHVRNGGFYGEGRAIDPRRHFIVSVNMFGNGYSSSPSNANNPQSGANFPGITLYDNVAAQHRLLTEQFGIDEIALVAGWSMAGCQSFQWGAQFPQMVRAILPFCASAKVAEHNWVFLEGVKAALQADAAFDGGRYRSPPQKGLKAFARVYAGWAYSQTFFREQLYRQNGFDSAEALLQDWEKDHLAWDANDLLCKLNSWQRADISCQSPYRGDFKEALAAISARCIVIACDSDLYFRPADNEIEVAHMPEAQLRIVKSAWGHCVASPGNKTGFDEILDGAIAELLD